MNTILNKDLDIIRNEDGTYTLTEKQIQGLIDGDIKLIDGRLYLDASKVMVTHEPGLLMVDGKTHQPIGFVKPSAEDLIPSPIDLDNVGNKDSTYVVTAFQPRFSINEPTERQKERAKKKGLTNLEIKGVTLKSSKRSPAALETLKHFLEYLDAKKDAHPYEWVTFGAAIAEGSDDYEGSKKIILETLNTLVPLKPGMKLENLSSFEFDTKYLYTSASLLEQAEAELEEKENKDNRDILLLLSELYRSPSIEKPETSTFLEFTKKASILFDEYEIGALSKGLAPFKDPWEVALDLQNKYWDDFRGWTITILRLIISIKHPGDKDFDLTTPIDGMRNR